MGGGRYTADDWKDYSVRSGVSKATSASAVYTSHGLDKDLDPKKIKGGIRECCDGPDHPETTAIAVGLDVTGSMDPVLFAMAKQGMNTLVTELYDRKPVVDPAIMCMAVGDAEMGDRAPLQVTQFEADIRIQEQLAKLYLEGGGGGNAYESYALAWYFAATKTKIDCFIKRKKKGYLFTIGDEGPTPYLLRGNLKEVLGDAAEADIQLKEILTLVSRQWEVFHVIVEEGNHYRMHSDTVSKQWREILGQRALHLADHTKLAEVVVSAIQVNEGAKVDDVVASWDGNTRAIVKKATAGLGKKAATAGGIVTL